MASAGLEMFKVSRSVLCQFSTA